MLIHIMFSNGARAYFNTDGRVAYIGSHVIKGTDMRLVRASVGQPVTIDNNGQTETWIVSRDTLPVFIEALDEQTVIDTDSVPISALAHLIPSMAIPG